MNRFWQLMMGIVIIVVVAYGPAPVQAQAGCTPPPGALVAVRQDEAWMAWADGYTLTFANCVQEFQVSILTTSAVTNLMFDTFPLLDNLYWTTADGGIFQVNVTTGILATISPPNPYIPAGNGGGAHGATQDPSEVVTPTLTPPVRSTEAVPLPHDGLGWLQWIGARLGF